MDLQPSACLDAMTIMVFATNPTNACKFISFSLIFHFSHREFVQFFLTNCLSFLLLSCLDANWDGKESCVTSASAIQVVFMDLANNRGNVTAMKVGVVCFAIKILTTAPITNPARTAAPVFTRAKVCTCPAEYTGTDCELVKDDCTVIPCLNGGTCSVSTIKQTYLFLC
jgi:hypothetical protein